MHQGMKNRRLLDRVMLFAMLLGVSALPAFGQIDRGAITGRILDASGAVVPSATVTITNKATGVAMTTPVDADGEYQVLTLIPGTYSVKATAAGFESVLRDDIHLHVQDLLSIDFALKVGAVNSQIVVTARESMLETQTADLGSVVNEQRINDLPLNGRRYADLALLEPGVAKFYAPANPAPDRFSANGNSELQNNFLLDGITRSRKTCRNRRCRSCSRRPMPYRSLRFRRARTPLNSAIRRERWSTPPSNQARMATTEICTSFSGTRFWMQTRGLTI